MFVTIMAMLASLSFAGCKDSSKETSATPPTSAIELSAQQLWSAYNANEVTADDQYRGKRLIVTSTVNEIKKDVGDNPYLVLSAGDANEVWAYLVNLSDARSLHRGSKVRVSCIGRNVVLGSPVLADCSLADPVQTTSPSSSVRTPTATSDEKTPSYIGKSQGEMTLTELKEEFRTSSDQAGKCLSAVGIAQDYYDEKNIKEARRWKDTARKLGCDQLPLGYSQLEF